MDGTQGGFVDFVCEHLAELGEIRSRRMFGGHCLYCDGTLFALIARNTLYLKADEVTRAEFECRGMEAFRPFPDRKASLSYYLAPPEFFEDAEAAVRWGGKAIEAGVRVQRKKRKTGTARAGTKTGKRRTT